MILSDVEWQAVELSLKVSATAVVASLPFGIFLAWARDELAIKPGMWLFAQIKSVSVTA